MEPLSIQPNLTFRELQRSLDIDGDQPSTSTVYWALRDSGMTYKSITKIPIKRNEEKTKHMRSEFCRQISTVDWNHVVFIDEAGANRAICPNRGWSRRGVKVVTEVKAMAESRIPIA